RQVETDPRQRVVRRRDEEVEVLEVAEQSEVDGDGEREREFPQADRARSMDCEAGRPVPDHREGEQKDELPVPGGGEDKARGDEDRPPALRVRHQKPAQEQDDDEEDCEGRRRKKHAGSSLGTAGIEKDSRLRPQRPYRPMSRAVPSTLPRSARSNASRDAPGASLTGALSA